MQYQQQAAATAAAMTSSTTVPARATCVEFGPRGGSTPQRGCVGRHLANRNEVRVSAVLVFLSAVFQTTTTALRKELGQKHYKLERDPNTKTTFCLRLIGSAVDRQLRFEQ